jgi:acyl carrier protein
MYTSVTKDQIEERIGAALAEFGADPADIARDTPFEQLDVDSLDLVELAAIVEEDYGIQLKGDDLKQLRTVGDAIDMVAARAG